MTNSMRTIVAILATAALSTFAACSSNTKDVPVIGAVSTMGTPSIVVKNNSTVPMEVTIWMTERLDDYGATWEDMVGRTEIIEVNESRRFLVPEHRETVRPLARIEVETRGPTFEQTHRYWFESLSSPDYTVALEGPADSLQLNSRRAVVVAIPPDRVYKDRRLQERPGRTPRSADADPGN